MGANWSEYSEPINLEQDNSNFTCYICNKQKNELRVQSLACGHNSCVDCISASSYIGLMKDVRHDTVMIYHPPSKGMFKVPGLCSVCFVENAIKSPNFHESSFYFKRNSGNLNTSGKDINTKVL